MKKAEAMIKHTFLKKIKLLPVWRRLAYKRALKKRSYDIWVSFSETNKMN